LARLFPRVFSVFGGTVFIKVNNGPRVNQRNRFLIVFAYIFPVFLCVRVLVSC
jgi:hypothetical protein